MKKLIRILLLQKCRISGSICSRVTVTCPSLIIVEQLMVHWLLLLYTCRNYARYSLIVVHWFQFSTAIVCTLCTELCMWGGDVLFSLLNPFWNKCTHCFKLLLLNFCAMKSLRLFTEFKAVIGRNFLSCHMLVSFQPIDRIYFYHHIQVFFQHTFLPSEIIL